MLIKEIEADLVGPRGGPSESFPLNPKHEYLAGVLYPLSVELDREESISEDDSSEDGETETRISPNNLFKPSSFGLTCRVPCSVKTITAHVEYGTYEKRDGSNKGYQRTPQSEEFNIDLTLKDQSIKFALKPVFEIKYSVIRKSSDHILDLYVINKSKNREESLHDIMFQPRITLKSSDGNPTFLSGTWDNKSKSKEIDHFDLLFYDKISFGKGHLCAVAWDSGDVRDKMASKIWTTFVPTESVSAIVPTENTLEFTSMYEMGTCRDKATLKLMLEKLIPIYLNWVVNIEEKIPKMVNQQYVAEAHAAVRKCREAARRMQKGIDTITNDDNAFSAFKFTNMAIAWQQTMSKWSKANAARGNVEGHEPLDPDRNIRWRIFQIAFILLNIESLVNPRSEDRETVDLL